MVYVALRARHRAVAPAARRAAASPWSLRSPCPWFVLAELRNPGFADFFFVPRAPAALHCSREHRRPGPWWYFIPIAIVFLMPWLPAIVVVAVAQAAPSARRRPRAAFDVRKPSRGARPARSSCSSACRRRSCRPTSCRRWARSRSPSPRRSRGDFDCVVRHHRGYARSLAGIARRGARAYRPRRFIKVPMVREEFATGIAVGLSVARSCSCWRGAGALLAADARRLAPARAGGACGREHARRARAEACSPPISTTISQRSA